MKTLMNDDAKNIFWKRTSKNKLEKVYKEIEEPQISIIDEMEKTDKIDKNYLKKPTRISSKLEKN